MADTALIIFSRAPVAGAVKTRLIPELGADGAARLQIQLLQHIIPSVTNIGGIDTFLYATPETEHPLFQSLSDLYALTLRAQPDGDLGRRMHTVSAEILADYRNVILIGSDCPLIDATYINRAVEALAEADAVFGPAEDGGYVLVGLKQALPLLFEGIEWGSNRVMQQTLEKGRDYKIATLETLWDVDRAEDVERFRRLLADASANFFQV